MSYQPYHEVVVGLLRRPRRSRLGELGAVWQRIKGELP
jgi:hypothetical protein